MKRIHPFTLAMVALSLFVCVSLGAQSGKRYALVVGIDTYGEGIASLRTSVADARAMKAVLASWDTVILMSSDQDWTSPDFPTKAKVERTLRQLADRAGAGDTVLVFFSGHGMQVGPGSKGAPPGQYLLPVDADLGRPAETAIHLESMLALFHDRGVNRVLTLVDACREEVATTKGIGVVGLAAPSGAGGRASGQPAASLYATGPGSFSHEDPEGSGHSVFTRFILEGMAGKADGQGGPRDGSIQLSELAAWLPDAVADFSLRKRIQQEPVVTIRDQALASLKLGPVGSYKVRSADKAREPVPAPEPAVSGTPAATLPERDYKWLWADLAAGVVTGNKGGLELDLGGRYMFTPSLGLGGGLLIGRGAEGLTVGASIHGMFMFTPEFGLGAGFKGMPWYLSSFVGPSFSAHYMNFMAKVGYNILGTNQAWVVDVGYSLGIL